MLNSQASCIASPVASASTQQQRLTSGAIKDIKFNIIRLEDIKATLAVQRWSSRSVVIYGAKHLEDIVGKIRQKTTAKKCAAQPYFGRPAPFMLAQFDRTLKLKCLAFVLA